MKTSKDQLIKSIHKKAEKLSSADDLILILKEISDWSPNYYDVGEIIMATYLNMQKIK